MTHFVIVTQKAKDDLPRAPRSSDIAARLRHNDRGNGQADQPPRLSQSPTALGAYSKTLALRSLRSPRGIDTRVATAHWPP